MLYARVKHKFSILLKQVSKTTKEVFINISTDGKVYYSSRPNQETMFMYQLVTENAISPHEVKQKYIITLKQVSKVSKDVFINISTDGKVYYSSRHKKSPLPWFMYQLVTQNTMRVREVNQDTNINTHQEQQHQVGQVSIHTFTLHSD